MSPVFGHGRLRLYLLKLLDEAPRHGYEVIRLLQDRFMGVYAPSPGTIYPRLARLEEEGLLTHDEEDGRKIYRITDKGREEINRRLDELDDLEREITESVSGIAREVKEDVRETVRSLREELTWATREVHKETKRSAQEQARQTREEARERARQVREELRQARGEAPGQGHGRAPHEEEERAGARVGRARHGRTGVTGPTGRTGQAGGTGLTPEAAATSRPWPGNSGTRCAGPCGRPVRSARVPWMTCGPSWRTPSSGSAPRSSASSSRSARSRVPARMLLMPPSREADTGAAARQRAAAAR